MFENNEVYVIEKYDKIKDCYVFWNVVSDYKKAKEYIYKYMLDFTVPGDGKITLSDGQINEYDYFTVACTFSDYPTITDKFRGHRTSFTQSGDLTDSDNSVEIESEAEELDSFGVDCDNCSNTICGHTFCPNPQSTQHCSAH